VDGRDTRFWPSTNSVIRKFSGRAEAGGVLVGTAI
jgi:hypothetical protein